MEISEGGKKFGKRTIIKYLKELSVNRNKMVIVKCDCGKESKVCLSILKRGKQNQCISCSVKTHGMSSTKEFSIWNGIKNRCNGAKEDDFKNYTLKGIKVCDRWKKSFENFYEDMGPAPTKNHSIDRYDGAKDYSPDNCRWATKSEQALNTKKRNKKDSLPRNVYRTPYGYMARLRGMDGKKICLGTFPSIVKAEKAALFAYFRIHHDLPPEYRYENK
jgi:hypothetical protein